MEENVFGITCRHSMLTRNTVVCIEHAPLVCVVMAISCPRSYLSCYVDTAGFEGWPQNLLVKISVFAILQIFKVDPNEGSLPVQSSEQGSY